MTASQQGGDWDASTDPADSGGPGWHRTCLRHSLQVDEGVKPARRPVSPNRYPT